MPSIAQLRSENIDYVSQLVSVLPTLSYDGAMIVYKQVLRDPKLNFWVLGQLGLHDRFFLLAEILQRPDVCHPWLYDRCREVEAAPDGHIDLWARYHYKSSIITFAGVIQEIAKDSYFYRDLKPPDMDVRGKGKEITICILANSLKIANPFLQQIKLECERNSKLNKYWPDVFWEDPKRESPVWSIDKGLLFKRDSNPKEMTVESFGLVDSQPTSKHFKLLIYDDTVTKESVATPDMIIKTTEAWELSRFIVTRDTKQYGKPRTQYVGTRYNHNDTYQVILNRKAAIPRVHAATDTGTKDGKPVFLSQQEWDKMVKETSAFILAAQMLQNPTAGEQMEFKPDWIRRYEIRPETLNVAILVDPASSKKKGTSNTAFAVVGIDANHNKYLLDGACHKMKLSERWVMLKSLWIKWTRAPGVQSVCVGYEKYGMQADIEHHEEMMQIEKTAFPITEVSWTRDDTNAKDDRIRRLIPDHQNWRFFYPHEGEMTSKQMQMEDRGKSYLIAKPIKRINEDGRVYNLVDYLINNEYLFFPATTQKDLMDAMSRFYDMNMNPPMKIKRENLIPAHMHEEARHFERQYA